MVSGRDLRRNLLHPEGETHCLRGMEAETHTIPDEPWKAQTGAGKGGIFRGLVEGRHGRGGPKDLIILLHHCMNLVYLV